jgi:hypothetical protein
LSDRLRGAGLDRVPPAIAQADGDGEGERAVQQISLLEAAVGRFARDGRVQVLR